MKNCQDSHGLWSQGGRGMWLFLMLTVGIMCGLATVLVK